MFTEEVGYSPLEGSPGSYEARVRGLVAEGRSYLRSQSGRTASRCCSRPSWGRSSSQVAQVQGVWVPPDRRGEGLATAGMAAVVAATVGKVAPQVSLYVNDYNTAALRVYEKVGFRQVGTYATVLF